MPQVRVCPSWEDDDPEPQRLLKKTEGADNKTSYTLLTAGGERGAPPEEKAPLSPILEGRNKGESLSSLASHHSEMLGSESSDDSDDRAAPPPPPAAGPKKPYLGKADQSAFVRRSNKYWVRNGDVPILKAFISSHIKKARDGLIQSVYLDGDAFPLYNSRLQAEEGSTLVRLRWYGDTFPPKDLYVERKIHHECHLTTALSMKERFVIPARELGPLLDYRLNDLTIKKADGDGNLPDEIVRKLKESGAKPKLRTEYFRTAWEDEEIPEYRISLDEYVSYFKDEDFGSMARPSGWECLSKTSNPGYWAFPFSILEVKVDMAAAMQKKMAEMGIQDGPMPGLATKELGLSEEAWEPEWVTMAKDQNLILTTCKYSKFLSATAWIYGGCGDMGDSPYLHNLPEYMPILQDETAKNGLEGKLPTVTGMKLTNKHMVKRNLTVEPKTWMATERTFIKWLQLAAMIFLIPLLMDKFQVEDNAYGDHRGHKVATYIMLIVGIFVTCYAFVVYVYRIDLLKNKKVGQWYDIKGCFLVVFTLLLAHLLILADKIVDDT